MKKVIFLALLSLAVSCTKVKTDKDTAGSATQSALSTPTHSDTDPELKQWTSEMDGSKRYTLHFSSDGSGEAEGDLLIRCSSSAGVEAYVSFSGIVESTDGRSAVRVKFDDQAPSRIPRPTGNHQVSM